MSSTSTNTTLGSGGCSVVFSRPASMCNSGGGPGNCAVVNGPRLTCDCVNFGINGFSDGGNIGIRGGGTGVGGGSLHRTVTCTVGISRIGRGFNCNLGAHTASLVPTIFGRCGGASLGNCPRSIGGTGGLLSGTNCGGNGSNCHGAPSNGGLAVGVTTVSNSTGRRTIVGGCVRY